MTQRFKHTIIGLTGKKRSGKDTVATFLTKHYGFEQIAFATPLKQACQQIFTLSDAQLHDQTLKETIDPRWGVSPRKLLQTIGTELFREQLKRVLPEITIPTDMELWCYCTALRIRALPTPRRIVFTDIRYEDEAKLVTDLGGILVRIDRQIEQSTDTHASETCDIQSQFTIVNDGTLEELEAKSLSLVKNFISEQSNPMDSFDSTIVSKSDAWWLKHAISDATQWFDHGEKIHPTYESHIRFLFGTGNPTLEGECTGYNPGAYAFFRKGNKWAIFWEEDE